MSRKTKKASGLKKLTKQAGSNFFVGGKVGAVKNFLAATLLGVGFVAPLTFANIANAHDSLEAAVADGSCSSYTLMSDETVTKYNSVARDFTVNGSGYKISGTTNAKTLQVYNAKTLTLNNLVLDGITGTGIGVSGNAKAVLTDCSIKNITAPGYVNGVAFSINGSNSVVTLKGTTVITGNNFGGNGGPGPVAYILNGATMNLTGTVTATGNHVGSFQGDFFIHQGGTINIYDGTVTDDIGICAYTDYSHKAYLNVGDGATDALFNLNGYVCTTSKGVISINIKNKGTMKSKGHLSMNSGNLSVAQGGTLEMLSGGNACIVTTGNIDNSGTISVNSTGSVTATDITNTGTLSVKTGNITATSIKNNGTLNLGGGQVSGSITADQESGVYKGTINVNSGNIIFNSTGSLQTGTLTIASGTGFEVRGDGTVIEMKELKNNGNFSLMNGAQDTFTATTYTGDGKFCLDYDVDGGTYSGDTIKIGSGTITIGDGMISVGTLELGNPVSVTILTNGGTLKSGVTAGAVDSMGQKYSLTVSGEKTVTVQRTNDTAYSLYQLINNDKQKGDTFNPGVSKEYTLSADKTLSDDDLKYYNNGETASTASGLGTLTKVSGEASRSFTITGNNHAFKGNNKTGIEVSSGNILTLTDISEISGWNTYAVNNNGTVNIGTTGTTVLSSVLTGGSGHYYYLTGGTLEVADVSNLKQSGHFYISSGATLALGNSTEQQLGGNLYYGGTVKLLGDLKAHANRFQNNDTNTSIVIPNGHTLTFIANNTSAQVGDSTNNEGTLRITSTSGSTLGGKVYTHIDNDGILTINAGNILNTVDNAAGTVTLNGGTLADGKTITGGSIIVSAEVTANADDLVSTGGITINDDKTLTLNGGTIADKITMADTKGYLAIAGTVMGTDNETVTVNKLTISSGSLTVDPDDLVISNGIVNNAAAGLVFNATGELGSTEGITGNGTTTIDGGTDGATLKAGAAIKQNITLTNAKDKLIIAVGNLQGAVTNAGTVELTGTGPLTKTIDGGTIIVDEAVSANADYVKGAVTNKGTLTLTGGSAATPLTLSVAVTGIGSMKIGTDSVAAYVSADADKIGVATEVVKSDSILTLTGDNKTLAKDVTGAGKTVIDGTVTSSASIGSSGGIEIASGKSLTIGAGNLAATTQNDGTLNLNAGLLGADIQGLTDETGYGATVIKGAVTNDDNHTIKQKTLTISSGSLKIDADNLTITDGIVNNAENGLVFNADGTLQENITGIGTTKFTNNATTTLTGTLEQAATVDSGAGLTIGATNLKGAVTNSGNVTLNAGTLDTNGSVSGSGTITTGGAVSADVTKLSTSNTASGIINANTLTLTGTGALGGIITGAGSTVIDGTITSGKTITQKGLTISSGSLTTDADNLTITDGIVNNAANGLVFNAEGTLQENITGTGSTKFTNNATTTLTGTLQQAATVESGAGLIIDAANLMGDTENKGTLTLTGTNSDLGANISGTGKTVVSGTVTDTSGKVVTQKSLEITGSLTIGASQLVAVVANNGTLNLGEGTLASGSTITGGVLNVTGDVSTVGTNLVAGTGTNSLVVSEGKTLTISSGDLARNVTGVTGTTKFTGTTTSTATIANKIDVDGGTLTINADNIDGTGNTVTSGTLKLAGGKLEKEVSGAGTTEIIADTTLAAKLRTDITVDGNITLTSSANYIGGAVENDGTLSLEDGTLNEKVSGGTLNITGDVSANATNIYGDTNTIAENQTLTLTAGALEKAITGAGTTAIDGTVTSTASIGSSGGIEVNEGSSLTIGASNLAAAVTNNGTITLNGEDGTLSYDITTGTLNIGDELGTADQVTLAANIGAVNIKSDGTLIAETDKLTGSVTNNGTLTLTGTDKTFSKAVTGDSGTVNIGTAETAATITVNAKLTATKGINIANSGSTLKIAATNVGGNINNGGKVTLTGENNAALGYDITDTQDTKTGTVTVEGSVGLGEHSISAKSITITGSLTANAGNLSTDTSILNDGTLILTGGSLDETVTSSSGKTGQVQVQSGAVTLSSADNMSTQDVTLNGTLKFANTDSGDKTIAKTLTIESSGTLDLEDGQDRTYTVTTLTGKSGTVNFDMVKKTGSHGDYLAELDHDIITTTTATGTIKLGSINMAADIYSYKDGDDDIPSGKSVGDMEFTSISLIGGDTTGLTIKGTSTNTTDFMYTFTQDETNKGQLNITKTAATFGLREVINAEDMAGKSYDVAGGVGTYSFTADVTNVAPYKTYQYYISQGQTPPDSLIKTMKNIISANGGTWDGTSALTETQIGYLNTYDALVATEGLGTLTPASGKTTRTLTINGNGYTLNGGGFAGVTVNSGSTLNIVNVSGVSNFASNTVVTNKGTLNLQDSTMDGTVSAEKVLNAGVAGTGTLNLKSSKVVLGTYSSDAKETAYQITQGNMNIDSGSTFSGYAADLTVGTLTNEGTLTLRGGTTAANRSTLTGTNITGSGTVSISAGEYVGIAEGNSIANKVDLQGNLEAKASAFTGGKITLTAGTLNLKEGILTQEIALADSSTGTLNINKGTVTGNATVSVTDMNIAAGTTYTTEATKLTVTNAINDNGELVLTGGNTEAAVTFANAVSGSGKITVNGYIKATKSLEATAGITVAKDKTLQLNATLIGTAVTNNGTVYLDADTTNNKLSQVITGGNIVINGNVTSDVANLKGAVTNAAGKTLTLTGGSAGNLSNLTVTVGGAGTLAVEGFVNITAKIDNAITIKADKVLAIDADNVGNIITNNGTLNLGTGTLKYALTGTGVLNITGAVVNATDNGITQKTLTLTGGTATTLIANVNNLTITEAINNSGEIKLLGEGSISNTFNGTDGKLYIGDTTQASDITLDGAIYNLVTVATGSTLTMDPDNVQGAITNNGTLMLEAAGTLAKDISGTGDLQITTDGDVVNATGSTISQKDLDIWMGTLAIDPAKVTLTGKNIYNAGTLQLVGSEATLDESISGSGTTMVPQGSNITITGELQQASVVAGTMKIAPDNIQGKVTLGSGTIETVAPGTFSQIIGGQGTVVINDKVTMGEGSGFEPVAYVNSTNTTDVKTPAQYNEITDVTEKVKYIPVSGISIELNEEFVMANTDIEGGAIQNLTMGKDGHMNLQNGSAGTLVVAGNLTVTEGAKLSLDVLHDSLTYEGTESSMDGFAVFGTATGTLTLGTINLQSELIIPKEGKTYVQVGEDYYYGYKDDEGNNVFLDEDGHVTTDSTKYVKLDSYSKSVADGSSIATWVALPIGDSTNFSIVGAEVVYGEYTYAITYVENSEADNAKQLKITKQTGFSLQDLIQATSERAGTVGSYMVNADSINMNHAYVKGGDLGELKHNEGATSREFTLNSSNKSLNGGGYTGVVLTNDGDVFTINNIAALDNFRDGVVVTNGQKVIVSGGTTAVGASVIGSGTTEITNANVTISDVGYATSEVTDFKGQVFRTNEDGKYVDRYGNELEEQTEAYAKIHGVMTDYEVDEETGSPIPGWYVDGTFYSMKDAVTMAMLQFAGDQTKTSYTVADGVVVNIVFPAVVQQNLGITTSTSTLTTNADRLVISGGTIENAGTLALTGGTLDEKLTGAGTLAIAGTVAIDENMEAAGLDNKVSVYDGKILTAKADVFGQTVTNRGYIRLTGGTLGAKITDGDILGEIELVGDVTTSADNLLSRVVNKDKVLTLTEGEITKDIGGSDSKGTYGNLAVTGKVTNSADIVQNNLTVSAEGEFTTDVEDLDLKGSITNEGTITLSGSGDIDVPVSGEGTLQVAGTLVAEDPLAQKALQITAEDATLTIATNNLNITDSIENAGTLTLNEDGTLEEAVGAYTTTAGATAGTVVVAANVVAGAAIANSIEINSGMQLTIAAANVGGMVDNEGTLVLTGGTSAETISALTKNVFGGDVNVAGYVANTTDNTLSVDNLTVSGYFQFNGNDLAVSETLKNNGALAVTGGTLGTSITTDAPGSIVNEGGELKVNGSKVLVTGDVNLTDKVASAVVVNAGANLSTKPEYITNGVVLQSDRDTEGNITTAAKLTVNQSGSVNTMIGGLGTVEINKDITMGSEAGFLPVVYLNAADNYNKVTLAQYETLTEEQKAYCIPVSGVSVDLNAQMTITSELSSGSGALSGLTMGDGGHLNLLDGSAGTIIVAGDFNAGTNGELSLDVLSDSELDSFAVLGNAQGTLTLKTVNVASELIAPVENKTYIAVEEEGVTNYYYGYQDAEGNNVFLDANGQVVTDDTREKVKLDPTTKTISAGQSIATWVDIPITGTDSLTINTASVVSGLYMYTVDYVTNSDAVDKGNQLKLTKQIGFTLHSIIQGGTNITDDDSTNGAKINSYSLAESAYNVEKVTVNGATKTTVGGGRDLGILTRTDAGDYQVGGKTGGSTTRTLSLNGNNNNLDGAGWAGITVQEGDTLNLTDLANITNFANGIVATNDGTLNLNGGTVTVNAGVTNSNNDTTTGKMIITDAQVTMADTVYTLSEGAATLNFVTDAEGTVTGMEYLNAEGEAIGYNATATDVVIKQKEIELTGTATLNANPYTLQVGTITNNGVLNLHSNPDATKNILTANVTGTGTVNVLQGMENLTIKGTMASGMTIESEAAVTADADLLQQGVTNEGTLTLTGNDSNTLGVKVAGAGTTNIDGIVAISETGELATATVVQKGATLTNNGFITGDITVEATGKFVSDSTVSGAITNNGTMVADASFLTGEKAITNNAEMTLNKGTLTRTVSGSGTTVIDGSVSTTPERLGQNVEIANEQELTLTSGGTLAVNVALAEGATSGTVVLDGSNDATEFVITSTNFDLTKLGLTMKSAEVTIAYDKVVQESTANTNTYELLENVATNVVGEEDSALTLDMDGNSYTATNIRQLEKKLFASEDEGLAVLNVTNGTLVIDDSSAGGTEALVAYGAMNSGTITLKNMEPTVVYAVDDGGVIAQKEIILAVGHQFEKTLKIVDYTEGESVVNNLDAQEITTLNITDGSIIGANDLEIGKTDSGILTINLRDTSVLTLVGTETGIVKNSENGKVTVTVNVDDDAVLTIGKEDATETGNAGSLAQISSSGEVNVYNTNLTVNTLQINQGGDFWVDPSYVYVENLTVQGTAGVQNDGSVLNYATDLTALKTALGADGVGVTLNDNNLAFDSAGNGVGVLALGGQVDLTSGKLGIADEIADIDNSFVQNGGVLVVANPAATAEAGEASKAVITLGSTDNITIAEGSKLVLHLDEFKADQCYTIVTATEGEFGTLWGEDALYADDSRYMLSLTGTGTNNYVVKVTYSSVDYVFGKGAVITPNTFDKMVTVEDSAGAEFVNKIKTTYGQSDATKAYGAAALNAVANLSQQAGVQQGAISMANQIGETLSSNLGLTHRPIIHGAANRAVINKRTLKKAEMKKVAVAKKDAKKAEIKTVKVGKAAEVMPKANITTPSGYTRQVWASYIRSKDRVDGMQGGLANANYDLQLNGATVGTDLWSGASFVGGIALTYATGDVTSYNSISTRNKAKHYGVNIYNRVNTGRSTVVLYDVGYTNSKNEIAQHNTGTEITADAKTDSFTAGILLQKGIKIGKAGTLAPFMGVRYLRLQNKDYQDNFGVNYSFKNQNLVTPHIGFTWDGEFQMPKCVWTFRPSLEAGYRWNLGDRDSEESVRFGSGSPDVFGFNTADRASYYAKVGGEFISDRLIIGLFYQYTNGDKVKNSKWNINVSYKF